MTNRMSNETSKSTSENQDREERLSNYLDKLGIPAEFDREQLKAIVAGDVGFHKHRDEDVARTTNIMESLEATVYEARCALRKGEKEQEGLETETSNLLKKIMGRYAVLPESSKSALLDRYVEATEARAEITERGEILSRRAQCLGAIREIMDKATTEVETGDLKAALVAFCLLQGVHLAHAAAAKKVDQLIQSGEWREAARESEKFDELTRALEKTFKDPL